MENGQLADKTPVDNPGSSESLYNRGHGSLLHTASSQRHIRMADCRTCGPKQSSHRAVPDRRPLPSRCLSRG
ncbi:hypothetical protein CP880_07490 [Cutibacterium namnetense]|uniref:Uncharacterized protein n=1 Tax=Cutibacterium namnetense TaxID=1574624 RepID=A0ABX9I919_9ACTN|nr:hypothetical protein CP880_07490 [Cutibacterium namnetense]TKW72059.1 MAG: hypothetical protein DI580_05720 [Cutibacterium acnes]